MGIFSSSSGDDLNSARTQPNEDVVTRLLNSTITKAYKGVIYRVALNKFGHQFLFLEINGKNKPNDCGVMLEYGCYYDEYSDFGKYCYYWNNDGMRYSELPHEEFKPRYIIKEYQIKYNITLRQLIQSCWKNQSWKAEDFSWHSYNCQYFTCVALDFLR